MKSNVIPPMSLMPPMQMAMPTAAAHPMSVAMKPDRSPHPADKHRDVHGRMLPGNPHVFHPDNPLRRAAAPAKVMSTAHDQLRPTAKF